MGLPPNGGSQRLRMQRLDGADQVEGLPGFSEVDVFVLSYVAASCKSALVALGTLLRIGTELKLIRAQKLHRPCTSLSREAVR